MHEVGDTIELAWRVLDPSRRLTDADVTLTVVPPAGAAVAVMPSHPSTGEYRATYTPSSEGRHVIRWQATGTVSASRTDIVNVVSASEPVAIISLDYLRQHLNVSDDEHSEDDELRSFVDTASLTVEDYTGTVWARRTLVEDVYVSGGVAYLRPPVATVTSVTSLDGLTVYAVPAAGSLDGFTGTVSGMTDGWMRVTYVAGAAVVPEHVQKATAIIAAHLWETQRPATANAPSLGGFETTAPPSGRGYLIPNQASQLLGGKAPNRP